MESNKPQRKPMTRRRRLLKAQAKKADVAKTEFTQTAINRNLLKQNTVTAGKNQIEFPQSKAGEKVRLGNDVIVNGDVNHSGKITMPDNTEIEMVSGVLCYMKDTAGKQIKATSFK